MGPNRGAAAPFKPIALQAPGALLRVDVQAFLHGVLLRRGLVRVEATTHAPCAGDGLCNDLHSSPPQVPGQNPRSDMENGPAVPA